LIDSNHFEIVNEGAGCRMCGWGADQSGSRDDYLTDFGFGNTQILFSNKSQREHCSNYTIYQDGTGMLITKNRSF